MRIDRAAYQPAGERTARLLLRCIKVSSARCAEPTVVSVGGFRASSAIESRFRSSKVLPLLAFLVATAALLLGALTPSGAAVAAVVGTVTLVAGWRWAGALLLFFVIGTAASRFREQRKAALTENIIAKRGARDAWQVVANGGVFAVCAFVSQYRPEEVWWWAACGALAAAMADSLATELGTLSGGPPRSLIGGRELPVGTSGGVTWTGTLAGALGALLLAVPASAVEGGGLPGVLVLVTAGTAGSLADSALGAAVQHRRWCEKCQSGTERRVHTCGESTVHAGGIPWLDNDAVNLVSTLVGAAVGAAGAWLVVA